MKHLFKKTIGLALMMGTLALGLSANAQDVKVNGSAKAEVGAEHRKGGHQRGEMGKTPEERVEKRVQQMTKQLSLTEAQATQIRTILLEQANVMKQRREQFEARRDEFKNLSKEEREAKKEEMKAKRESMKGEMKAERDALKTRIGAVLTAEQKAKLETLRDQRKEFFKDRLEERKERRHEMKLEGKLKGEKRK